MTTYYTNQSGNNTDGLSLANGKTTIAGGLALLSPGDTLLINDGTYNEALRNNIPTGSIGNIVTLRAINNQQVIIKPNQPSNYYVIEMTTSRSYITLDGLIIDGEFVLANPLYIAPSSGSVHHIEILNCIIRNSVDDGSHTGGAIFQLGHHSNVAGVHHITVRGCEGYNGFSYILYIAGQDCLAENNYFHDAGSDEDAAIPDYVVHVFTTSQVDVDRNVIRNNLIVGNPAGVGLRSAVLLSSGDSNEFYNNIVKGQVSGGGILVSYNASNTKVYNNVVYNNNGTAIAMILLDNAPEDTIVRNNILRNNDSDTVDNSGGVDSVIDHNLLGEDPLFVDPDNVDPLLADFHLSEGSPAIGNGVNVGLSTDKDGENWEDPPSQGVYEFIEDEEPPIEPPANVILMGDCLN